MSSELISRPLEASSRFRFRPGRLSACSVLSTFPAVCVVSLYAAKSREIRSRCGFTTAEDGEGRGKRGKRSGRFIGGGDGGGDGGGSMGDGVGDKDFRTLGRKKAEKEAVKSARTAILRQNQRVRTQVGS